MDSLNPISRSIKTSAFTASPPRGHGYWIETLLRLLFPLFIVVLFTDLSNSTMKNFAIPSILQGLIVVMVLLVWRRRQHLRPERSVLHPVALLLAAYAVTLFMTTIWAAHAATADARVIEALKALVICILVATLAGFGGTLRSAATAMTVAAMVLGSISLLQIATGMLDPFFGGLLELETGTIYGRHAAPRAAGPPVSDPNFYARLLLLALPLGIALASTAVRRSARAGYLLASLTIAATILATYSRGAMLALAVIGALTLLALKISIRTKAALTLAAIVAAILLPENVRERFLSIESIISSRRVSGERESSVEKRRLLMRSALEMFRDRPLVGVGAGHFGYYYLTYANRVGSEFTDYHTPGSDEYPHGLHLEVASETGLLGLLTLGSAFAAAGGSLLRSRRRLIASGRTRDATLASGVGIALAGYLVASLFLHETHLRYIGLQLGLVIAVYHISLRPRDPLPPHAARTGEEE